MKALLLTAPFLFLIAASTPATNPATNPASQPATQPQPPQWSDDYPAAVAQAKKDNKLLLLFFTGSDWCAPCAELQAKIFSSPEFAKWAAEKLLLVEADFPQKKQLPPKTAAQNNQLKKSFFILGYPTVIIIDPATERAVDLTIAYLGDPPNIWIEARNSAIAQSQANAARLEQIKSQKD